MTIERILQLIIFVALVLVVLSLLKVIVGIVLHLALLVIAIVIAYYIYERFWGSRHR